MRGWRLNAIYSRGGARRVPPPKPSKALPAFASKADRFTFLIPRAHPISGSRKESQCSVKSLRA